MEAYYQEEGDKDSNYYQLENQKIDSGVEEGKEKGIGLEIRLYEGNQNFVVQFFVLNRDKVSVDYVSLVSFQMW